MSYGSDLQDTGTQIDDLAKGEDISGGWRKAELNSATATLYISVGSSCDITVELSPDGANWYTEHTFSFSSAGETVALYEYSGHSIRLKETTNNGVSVTAQLSQR